METEEKKSQWRPGAGSSAPSQPGGVGSSGGADKRGDRKKSQSEDGGGVLRGSDGAEGAGNQPRVRRCGRRKAAAKERELQAKDNGLEELLLLLSTQAVSKDFAAGLRKQVSTFKETAKKAKGSDSALEKKSNEDADELRPAQEIGRVNREYLESVTTDMVDEPPRDVRLCRSENCEQEDMTKVVFALGDKTKGMQILENFRAMGTQG
ncbi:unnamed protein product [Prorocentrum cordatum]|uniref:Uncharacterized protein n=1 Tax=Prorocentrum cordatum TaxID=2364126 RepID=A0ABN9WZU0_9DINO|nr:unnamed protein product [Polarella glacialis]